MPVALISTSTSPSRGPSSVTSSMVSGAPAFQATAALVFMGGSPGAEKRSAAEDGRRCGSAAGAASGAGRGHRGFQRINEAGRHVEAGLLRDFLEAGGAGDVDLGHAV